MKNQTVTETQTPNQNNKPTIKSPPKIGGFLNLSGLELFAFMLKKLFDL